MLKPIFCDWLTSGLSVVCTVHCTLRTVQENPWKDVYFLEAGMECPGAPINSRMQNSYSYSYSYGSKMSSQFIS